MKRTVRFLLPLGVVLAVLAVIGATLLDRTGDRWAAKDCALRARLAIAGASEVIVDRWRSGELDRLTGILKDIARDERILGAAACGIDRSVVASTPDFPSSVDCRSVGRSVQEGDGGLDAWFDTRSVRGGRVHLSAIPVLDGDAALGYVVLLHDLSYADRRRDELRWLTLLAFGILALATAAVTTLVARRSWFRWTSELRRLVAGTGQRAEFQPLLRDVRELAARLAADATAPHENAWTPDRLRSVLRRHLEGERVLIVANREPYIHEKDGGQVKVVHPASGLVTALEPVLRACSGVWIAHGSGTADRETVDRNSRIAVPPGEGSYLLRRVWLTREEVRGYYEGFANEGLWPLCHIAHTRPMFRAEDWAHYRRVNRRFAEVVVAEADTDDPIVLVQDYHFALVPRFLRERLPRATILTFWHIPWPNAERVGICPQHEEILAGLLGSSILGFHTQAHCNHFLDAVDSYLEARIDRERHGVVQGGHLTLVRPYPISIEWPSRWAAGTPSAAECRARLVAELGLPRDVLLGVGVDRLDYTKGIEERLLAVERLLERRPGLIGRFTFVQLAAPSRTGIGRYKDLNDAVEAVASRINGRFQRPGWRPVALLRAHHQPEAVFRAYRAANLCYVSSLHDGMNLVAKEFVAARDDERGVLILSRFTGAARELTEALIVNPYDLDEAADAMATALSMSAEEQSERMRAMRSFVSEFNVYRWAGRMLVDAARIRQEHRLPSRLLEHLRAVEGKAS